ncbi:hypothetical protein D3C85_646580 [compost metagenome]
MRGLMRTLTPLGRLVLVGALVLLMAVAGRGLGLSWDPFNFQQRRLEVADARAASAERDADARRLEAAGQGRQAARVEIHHRQTLAVQRATVAAVTQARSAEDANDPLDLVRADRLRAHDRELCRLAPDLDGCAAAAGSF